MDRGKALSVAAGIVDAGWDVQINGRPATGQSVIESQWPEHWSVSIPGRKGPISIEELNRLQALVDVVRLDVYFNPVGGGLWLQERGGKE